MARSRPERIVNIWPGFVDGLTTLLLTLVFVLVVFVLAQFFLARALTGRDEALVRLNHQVAEQFLKHSKRCPYGFKWNGSDGGASQDNITPLNGRGKADRPIRSADLPPTRLMKLSQQTSLEWAIGKGQEQR